MVTKPTIRYNLNNVLLEELTVQQEQGCVSWGTKGCLVHSLPQPGLRTGATSECVFSDALR